MLMNNANKRIKTTETVTFSCGMFLACQIEIEFVDLTRLGQRSAACDDNHECFQGRINSRCVSLEGTAACLDYAEHELNPEFDSHVVMRWNNTRQNFYYSWDGDSSILTASIVSNHKKLKLEGKREVTNLVKHSVQNNG